jgi:HD superfamily phosphohydrolase
MLIRDPIHGDIALSRLEAAVLDCAAVQRLRGVKQLGTAHLVYPGAVHTRFDHSLGAGAVAHRIVAGLRRAGVEVPGELDDVIGVGALLHDVTHVPYGHTLEDERRLFPRHDKGDRLAQLLDGELGAALSRLGVRDAVADLLGAGHQQWPRWARDVISSTIDADLLDYLRRDAYFTGLAHDYDDRVFHYFTVADGELALQMSKHGMDRPDARSEVIQLLRMRYFLTERVYYHHTKVVAGAMISKAVELALDAGVLQEGDLLGLNDWTLLDRLGRCGSAPIAALIARLQRRDLLKRGYAVSAQTVGAAARAALVHRYHESRRERGAAETALAAALGRSAEEVIVYCPALTVMKEARARVATSRGVGSLNDRSDPACAEISALEERYANLWRLYVFVPAEIAERAAAASAELFGYPSEYQAGLVKRD